jgi:hypothetical protein
MAHTNWTGRCLAPLCATMSYRSDADSEHGVLVPAAALLCTLLVTVAVLLRSNGPQLPLPVRTLYRINETIGWTSFPALGSVTMVLGARESGFLRGAWTGLYAMDVPSWTNVSNKSCVLGALYSYSRGFQTYCCGVGTWHCNEAALNKRCIKLINIVRQIVLGDPGGIAHILQKKIYDYRAWHSLLKEVGAWRCTISIDHSEVVRPRIGRLMGEGLGWVEGEEEHKRMRKMMSPSLSYVFQWGFMPRSTGLANSTR